MDDILPARRDFLKLARLTLSRFDPDFEALNAPGLGTHSRVGITFVVEEVQFALVHSTDPEIDQLALLNCMLGPLPANAEGETCQRLLETNYGLSSRFVTGFTIDELQNVVYAHSFAISSWGEGSMGYVIKNFAALVRLWRDGGSLDANALGEMVDRAQHAPPLAVV